MDQHSQALIFIGGSGPDPEKYKKLLGPSDMVIAADSGLIRAEAFGYKPDWIVGDMDSLKDVSRLSAYPQDRIIRYPPDKDFTDTELALSLAWDKGYITTTLIGGSGGRTDHLLAILALFEREKTPSRWFTDSELVFPLEHSLELNLPLDTLISLFPVGPGPWEAESEGLKWPLNGLSWERGNFGLSNRTCHPSVSIKVLSGRFLVFIPLENLDAL
ncbi:MAG: thiamine diphosphokinase [Treponema sp.]|nr:thiamine diphosphokinase [Treponema sp.]